MVLMRSHLHGDEGESVEIFFGKLIQVMELAVKQIFSLIDTTDGVVDGMTQGEGYDNQSIRKDMQVDFFDALFERSFDALYNKQLSRQKPESKSFFYSVPLVVPRLIRSFEMPNAVIRISKKLIISTQRSVQASILMISLLIFHLFLSL